MRLPISLLLALMAVTPAYPSIGKPLQQEYKARYENQAVFLSVPIYGSRQRVTVREGPLQLQPEPEPLRFKVGEQVRILEVSFHNDEIRFKLASIDAGRQGELAFRFAAELDEAFSARKDFDAALRQAFAESQNYSDIDKSKRAFIRNQLDTVVAELQNSAAAKREFVLDALTEALPAYRQAVDENKALKDRSQDLAVKLSSEQSKSKQLETKVVEQTSELNRLKTMNQSMKTDLEALNNSTSTAGKELQQLKQQNAEIVSSVKRLQRGLGVEVDANKPLAKQVEDLMVASLKTKGSRDELEGKLKTAEGDLEKTKQDLQTEQKARAELQKQNQQLEENEKLLSNRGDQLGKRYLGLQKEKNQLEIFVHAIQKLKPQVVRETEDGDRVRRAVELRLNDTLVGMLEVDYPPVLKTGAPAELRVKFTPESVNTIKLNGEEKAILGSLGEKFTVKNELVDLPAGVQANPSEEAVKSVAERSSANWGWTVTSSRVGDSSFVLVTSLINQNKDAVPLIHNRLNVQTWNLARQLGHYLEPIPLVLGILFGAVLFAVIRVFRG